MRLRSSEDLANKSGTFDISYVDTIAIDHHNSLLTQSTTNPGIQHRSLNNNIRNRWRYSDGHNNSYGKL